MPRVPEASARLIERDGIVTALDQLLAGAMGGSGRIAVVSGPTATGKSRLLEVIADRAERTGALPVLASGSRSERLVPLSVLSQLMHNAPLTRTELSTALDLLRDGAANARLRDLDAERVEPADAPLVHRLCTILLKLSERGPLALLIDDAHYADRASLLCLAYLARRVRNARQLIVVSQADDLHPASSLLETELLRQPHCSRFELAALSVAGVAELAAEFLGRDRAARLAARWHVISGGNPLLVGGLIKDYQNDGDEHAAGECYGRAVVLCLHRAEPQHLLLARALAVLGSPGRLTALLGADAARVDRSLRCLERAGLLDGGAFRHEAARSAVLADMDTRTRTELHRAAAQIAHELGSPTPVAAAHLLASADAVGLPWAVPVLMDAARQALADGSATSAVGYLTLAEQACGEERLRAIIKAALVRAEWHIDPARSVRHLPALSEALRRGDLRGADGVALARALLWHGRFGEASAALERLAAASDQEADTAKELSVLRPWLRGHYPSFVPAPRQAGAGGPDGAGGPAIATTEQLESVTALSEVLRGGPRDDLSARATYVLRGARLGYTTMDTVEAALLALSYGERPHEAMPWCDRFLKQAVTRGEPGHQARLSAIRAEICHRLGDLPGAEHHARQALRLVPQGGWGVAIGGVAGTLLLALTGMGRYEEATGVVSEPVPDVMPQSRYALHYLYARARLYLAIGNIPAALRDLQSCGEQMRAWDLDAPALLPWRVDAAEAFLRLDQADSARELVAEHLARTGAHAPRAQGMGLRMLAATAAPLDRPATLRRSAAMLQAGRDRYEQAKTLADLASAHYALGEFRRARTLRQRAGKLARDCAAEPLIRALGLAEATSPAGMGRHATAPDDRGPDDRGPDDRGPDDRALVLSRAERRVGALAAAGYTNRQIAGRLFITVSTVEQHLSRIYRKLNIARRADLPASLEFAHSDSSQPLFADL